jgi:hypothetical protein
MQAQEVVDRLRRKSGNLQSGTQAFWQPAVTLYVSEVFSLPAPLTAAQAFFFDMRRIRALFGAVSGAATPIT